MTSSSTIRTTANPNLSPEARELLGFLYEISGRGLLTGQHNTPAHAAQYNEQAREITGKYPALWGQDFGFSKDDMDATMHRQAVMDEAKRQHALGTIITLMWHAVPPNEDEPVTFKGSIQGTISDEEWSELITPDSPLNRRWQAQVDVVAGFLAQLRDARVPVLWRPYHEMNGDWFWWGYRSGPAGYGALWKMLFDRLTHHHGLDNLIWVWNANALRGTVLPYEECFPDYALVDILATDVYGGDYKQGHHDDLAALAAGKPIAIGECGEVPSPDVLEKQTQWTWFMIWNGFLTPPRNRPEQIQALYDDPRSLHRPAREQWARRQHKS